MNRFTIYHQGTKVTKDVGLKQVRMAISPNQRTYGILIVQLKIKN